MTHRSRVRRLERAHAETVAPRPTRRGQTVVELPVGVDADSPEFVEHVRRVSGGRPIILVDAIDDWESVAAVQQRQLLAYTRKASQTRSEITREINAPTDE